MDTIGKLCSSRFACHPNPATWRNIPWLEVQNRRIQRTATSASKIPTTLHTSVMNKTGRAGELINAATTETQTGRPVRRSMIWVQAITGTSSLVALPLFVVFVSCNSACIGI